MIIVDKYTALDLQDNGQYGWSLMEGYVKDGDFKPSFVTKKVGKDRTEKTVPLNVKLGDKDKAIEVVKWLYKELTGDSDVPF